MRTTSGRLAATSILAATIATVTLAGCGGHSSAASRELPPARTQRVGHRTSVVLTPVGESRIQLRTATAKAAGGQNAGHAVIPDAALLYQPDGQAAVYVQTGPLSFTARFITVGEIKGDQVYVSKGLTPGTVVVSQGGEELLGVQDGVGVET